MTLKGDSLPQLFSAQSPQALLAASWEFSASSLLLPTLDTVCLALLYVVSGN